MVEVVNVPGAEPSAVNPDPDAAAAADAAAARAAGEEPAEGAFVLPEKFADEAALLKAYNELESKQSTGALKTDENGLAIPAVEGAAPEAMQEYVDNYAKNGKLEEADYAGLEKLGLPKNMVDSYIQGQVAIAGQAEAAAATYEGNVMTEAGGAESYGTLTSWAADNLSETEVAEFNRAVETGDINQAKSAVKGLMAQHQLKEGRAPTLLQGKTSGTGTASYQSLEQMKADMRDPRYHQDPAFRKSVSDKLANSNIM
jgi:hypothetical protein